MPNAFDAVPQEPLRRYSNVAVTLHWTTVALVLVQIYLGFAFDSMERGPARMEVFTWHKTLGAAILLVTLARLAYRLTNPPPPFPPELPRWERVAAVWNHRIFYLLLVSLPLAGLTAVSARTESWFTPLIGGIPLPVIPGVSKHVGELAGELHVGLALILLPLILIHIAAALKHQFIDRWRVSGRMPPFRSPAEERPVIGQGGRANVSRG